jgi:hypothetical protein
MRQKNRDELNGHPKQKHPNFREAFFFGYPLTSQLPGSFFWDFRKNPSVPGISMVGPVKISREYLALLSAAISIFYGK